MSDAGSVSHRLEGLRAGDAADIARLWDRYFPRLVALAGSRLPGHARRTCDEEDVAISAFRSFCERAGDGRFPQLDDRDDLWRLLATITARKAIRALEHRARQKRGGGRVLGESAVMAEHDSDEGMAQFLGREPTPEAVWRADERPELACFVADLSGPARERLFRGLLTLELEFRLGRGEAPDPSDYLDRFPEYEAAIIAAFAGFGLRGEAANEQTHGERARGILEGLSPEHTQFGAVVPPAELGPATHEALRSAGYEVLGELGRGGMGVVYLARKVALNRPCALKMILARPAPDWERAWKWARRRPSPAA